MARLFHVPLSPFCRKVRLSLAEKKIEVELVEERYWEADADFLRRNPAGKVPVLWDGDVVVWDSLAILEYLADKVGRDRFWPKADDARGMARARSPQVVPTSSASKRIP